MAGNRWGLTQEDLEGGESKVDPNKEGNGGVETIDLSDKNEGSSTTTVEQGPVGESFASEDKESIDSNQVGLSGTKYEVRDEEETTEESTSEPEVKVEIESSSQKEETKEEVEELSPYAQVMQDLVENEFVNYDEEKEYEGTAEELMQMVQETAERRGEEHFNSLINSVEDPKNREILESIKKGASFEDAIAIAQEEDFESWDLSNVNNQADAVGLLMQNRNPNDDHDTIKAKIQAYHKAGILEAESKKAVKELSRIQQETKDNYFKSIEEKNEAERVQLEKEAEEFKEDLLSREQIAGFDVSKQEVKDLYDFISLEDEDGKTGFEKSEEENVDSKMLYALLLMKKMDVNTLTKNIRKSETFKLKKKLGNYQDSKTSLQGESKSRSNPNDDGYVPISEIGSFNYGNQE